MKDFLSNIYPTSINIKIGGAFNSSPVTKIMFYPNVSTIGSNAFHEATIVRTVAGSYAEKWCLANDYVLSGAMGDFHEYMLRSTYQS